LSAAAIITGSVISCAAGAEVSSAFGASAEAVAELAGVAGSVCALSPQLANVRTAVAQYKRVDFIIDKFFVLRFIMSDNNTLHTP
jgi:hypothetical protein